MSLLWPTIQTGHGTGGEYLNDRGPGHIPRFHQGYDIAPLPVGSTVYASGPGVVEVVANTGTENGYGLYCRVRYEQLTVINAHLSRVDVAVGDVVTAKTILGASGGAAGSFGAGASNGPHDHLETRLAGVLVNPQTVLEPRSATAGGTMEPITETSEDTMKNRFFICNDGPAYYVGAPGLKTLIHITHPATLDALRGILATGEAPAGASQPIVQELQAIFAMIPV